MFIVEDTGPGIPPAMSQEIFERFRQIDDSITRRHGGTGLGLAIVNEFVRLHHGSVEAGEAPGGGARFIVKLPLSAPEGTEIQPAMPVVESDIAQGALADLHARIVSPRPATQSLPADAPLVLVVEDNPDMNAFIAHALGEHFRVATAKDGREGLDRARNLHPDLIVSDVSDVKNCRRRRPSR